MIKIVQLLEENPSLVELLRERKISLLGVTDLEQQAVLEAFDTNTNASGGSGYWI
ncbi:competence pheromone ComX [Lysinibacillus sp. NPDC096418]|uniref:competence pheromone ComX n=1 Tax=Lysinibacillus sp. NPDC096418 TaxID=3364138 RepID=UPI003810EB61